MASDPSGLMTGNDSYSVNYNSFTPEINNMLDQQINQIQNNISSLSDSGITLALNSSYTTSNATNYQPYKSYPTVEAAGVSAIMHINPTSIATNQEYGGLIYASSSGSAFMFNAPVSGGEAAVNPWSSYEYKAGWSVVGNYHTHGAYSPSLGWGNEQFSPADRAFTWVPKVGQYRFLGTPSGDVKAWQPGWGRQLNITQNIWETFR